MVVARGGFEPPKPLGRQIYSLLRLTAPQPRRLPHVRPQPSDSRHTYRDPARLPPNVASTVFWNHSCIVWMAPISHELFAFTLELAKGFEPPTC